MTCVFKSRAKTIGLDGRIMQRLR